MAEKKIKWTEQQQRAIAARGSDVLVTASAGTGKTAVLSGRCVDIVSDKSICPDVWSILVLTFTDAAAEQMRYRIADRLKAAFLRNADPHLRCQLMLLAGADISTIHSFCKRLITEYFYQLGLDPTFTVLGEDEQKLLKAEIIEKTIDWAWQQSNLQQPLQQLFYRRDLRTSDGFPAKIIALSNFLDGVIFRQNWFRQTSLLAQAANPFTTKLGKKQKQIVAENLQHILNQLRHAQKLCRREDADSDWADKCEGPFIKPVSECIELLKSGDWDKCAENIRNFSKPTIYKPKGLRESIAKLIKDTVTNAVNNFGSLSDLAIVNPDYLNKVSGSVGRQTLALLELVKKFDRLYRHTKKALNCLDFADLQHYALNLLTDESSSEDKILPSETALALRRRFKYIFVDEYQDISPVQQAILDVLSPRGNVFVVGDVKQSIYAFRGAEPKIFLENLKAASTDPKNAPGGFRVDLTTNFRSAKGILDFVNKVFSRIMTASFANIDYDESARLTPARPTGLKPQSATCSVELHILDEQSKHQSSQNHDGEGLNTYSSRQHQAAMIARRIRQMVGAETGKPQFQIYDKQHGCFRDVEYRDIVILMRSPANRVNDYIEVLRLAGVPVSCELGAGYFEATEISDIICLLKVLDNPQRDIELAAVLRSPFFKISDSELAKMKILSQTSEQSEGIYDCMLQYCADGPDAKLAEKLNKVLQRIEKWRTSARKGSLADLIWQIYRETNFVSFVSALPNGQVRSANLLKLHDRAIQFEGFAGSVGNLSLTRFVEFIEKLQQAGRDWAFAEPQTQAENAVRILSIHKSKGLEFPVVFVAELNSEFSKKDYQQDCLIDNDYTLGLRIIDSRSNTKLDSIAFQVIEDQKKKVSLAEEMRILYVAATRASDRLILTGSEQQKRCREIISNGLLFSPEPIPAWQLRYCRSPLEWILYGLSDQKNLHEAFGTDLDAKAVSDDLYTLKLYTEENLTQLSEYINGLRKKNPRKFKPAAKSTKPKRLESKLFSQVKNSLLWQYQFGDTPRLPAKQSVTQLTHRNDEYVRTDYSRALERKPKAVLSAESVLARPIEARLIGTAAHLVIAQLDLTAPVDKEAIEKTKQSLLADAAIIEAVAAAINTDSILAFFESELGKTVFQRDNRICREWPFTFTLPVSEFSDLSHERRATSDEVIIVQGIIDMLVQTPDGLLVIDFKSDQLTAEQVPERAELYRQQLEFYGKAAEAILKAKPLAKWLYFLTPCRAIEVV